MDRSRSPTTTLTYPTFSAGTRAIRATGPEDALRAAGFNDRPVGYSPLGVGVKSAVWQVNFDLSESLAWKVYNRSGVAAREQAAYRLLGEHSLALPRMAVGVEADEVFEFGWSLMTVAPGEALSRRLGELTRETVLGVYRSAGAFLAELHEYGRERFDNRAQISERFERALLRFDPGLAGQIRTMLERAPLEGCEFSALCHGDLHAENLRVDDAGAFVGALDLESSRRGDPTFDIVRTCHSLHPYDERVLDALIEGYGGEPPGFTDVFDLYFILCELKLWNYFAAGESEAPLESIETRIAQRVSVHG